MLEFAWPLAALALALPWLAMRLLPPAAPIATPLRVPFLAEARGWARVGGSARASPRLALALAVWVALVAAACRPQWVGEPVSVPVSGRSLLLALDVSASMRSARIGTKSGIEVMRDAAKRFVAGRHGDRIGLVVFGSRAYVQAPLTFDLEAVAAMIDDAFVGLAGEGTAFGDAIGLAVQRLRVMQDDARVLVAVTDGDSTDGTLSMLEAARLARHHGVRVHAIGVGGPQSEGMNEQALREVADITGGRYYHAAEPGALERVYAELDRAEPVAREERRLRPTRELYAWPLAVALALAFGALGATLALDRRRRRAGVAS